MDKEYYHQKLEEIQNVFCSGVSELLTYHVNYVINRYGNWKRYPRKVKKFLKKKQWWELKDNQKLSDGELKVAINKR